MKTQKNNILKIKTFLWNHELDVAKLSRVIGKSRTWTSLVLYGHRKSVPTRRAIATALGVNVSDLWPNKKRKAA